MSQQIDSGWVESPKWEERWERIRDLAGGGQGEAIQARQKDGGRVAFIKVIKSRNDLERRARFFREATAYDSFGISGVPKMIESNAHRHKDLSFKPYIVTEFIEGSMLRNWREAQGSVDLERAVAATRSLLITVRHCHENNCVHRDIKPDNIILRSDNPSDPVLLDFGLSYHEISEVDFRTEYGQEIGNRFLRLPELSAGSLGKQDFRSDITFVAGILFYIITAEHPDILQDAEGRLPHQRNGALVKLRSCAGVRFSRLAAMFDVAFSPQISGRFSNADAMLRELDTLMSTQSDSGTADDNLAAIQQFIDTEARRRMNESAKRIRFAVEGVQEVFSQVLAEFGDAFSMSQTGLSISPSKGVNTLIWSYAHNGQRVVTVTYQACEIGDELVIEMAGDNIYRTNLSDLKYGDAFKDAVRAWLLARVRSVIGDTV